MKISVAVLLRSTALLALALGLGACATPSNRRALYFPQQGLGPWHDYAQRQAVAASIGAPVSSLPRSSSATTTVTTPAPAPRSANAGGGAQPGNPLITPTPPDAQVPVPAPGSLNAPTPAGSNVAPP